MADTPLWTAKDAATTTGGTANGSWKATGISIDSRNISPGDLFIALSGPNFDGHEFAAAALEQGAAAVMISKPVEALPADAPSLTVDDTLKGLEALGRAGRDRTAAKIIAVTGSAGKTGTKDALLHALSAQGRTSASVASFNNHWGVPLSLARMPADTEFGVFEIGMNHPGEIEPLTKMVRPHAAIITTIAPAHIEFFDSIEQIADAKAEIFCGLEPVGTAILNADNEHFDRLRGRAGEQNIHKFIAFGETGSADARLISHSGDCSGSCVEADICGRHICYRLGLPGRHLAMNSLAVLAAIDAIGADVAAGAKALGNLAALPGRGQRHVLECGDGTFTLIDESYNANPASMRAAIQTLAALRPGPAGRKIAVLGDMRELGSDSRRFHAELGGVLEENNIDLVYASGIEMKPMFEDLPREMRGAHSDDAAAIGEMLAKKLHADDAVMIKGSLASNMGVVVQALLKEFKPTDETTNGKEPLHAV